MMNQKKHSSIGKKIVKVLRSRAGNANIYLSLSGVNQSTLWFIGSYIQEKTKFAIAIYTKFYSKVRSNCFIFLK